MKPKVASCVLPIATGIDYLGVDESKWIAACNSLVGHVSMCGRQRRRARLRNTWSVENVRKVLRDDALRWH